MANGENKLKVDCSKIPSDNNCQVVIIAPERQKTDLIDAAVGHAVKTHGHEDTPEFREATANFVESA